VRPTDVDSAADRFAVIDLETTGLSDLDRVVELAIVTVDFGGATVDEWTTLVDPIRDPGPSHIHGVWPDELVGAPKFAEIGNEIGARLHGAVLVAHNLFGFDARIIKREYRRLGYELDVGRGIDTLQLTQMKLAVACETHGISLERGHSALDDARAASELLRLFATEHLGVVRSVTSMSLVEVPFSLKPRSRVRVASDRDWLHRASQTISLAGAPPDELPYLDLLERAFSDFEVSLDEQVALMQLAKELGLSLAQQGNAHRRFLVSLIAEAVADDVVTDPELDQIVRFGELLGISRTMIESLTQRWRL
jgi:DNA polymerase III subunit epsilon